MGTVTELDQTSAGDNYKDARFYSMCGAEFCSVHIDQDARDADGEMTAIDDETNLDTSSAAKMNLPPGSTHDTSRVPNEIGIEGSGTVVTRTNSPTSLISTT